MTFLQPQFFSAWRKKQIRQGSLFSKAYRPLAQQCFSAGPLPPPLLHPLLGGSPLLCSLLGEGVHFCVHFWGSTSMFTSGGVHFRVHFRGWSTSMFTSRVGVYFCVHFWGDPFPCSLPVGCIMDKIHMGPPQRVGQTDRQTNTCEKLPSRTTRWAVKIVGNSFTPIGGLITGYSIHQGFRQKVTMDVIGQIGNIQFSRIL